MKLPSGARDLTGQRFGNLVAVEPIDVKTNVGVVWRCKCDCGNSEDILATRLTQRAHPLTMCIQCRKTETSEKRKAKHLSPPSFQDLTGQRFGMLTVIRRATNQVGPAGHHQTRWLCQCDCGSEPKEILAVHLKSGKIRSCGCIRGELITQKKRQPPRDIIDCGEYMYFETKGHKVLFDSEDMDIATMCKWTLDSNGYCIGIPDLSAGKIDRLHRRIMMKYQDIDSWMIDHKNGNKDDNRKCNLRLVTHTQNMQNTHTEPRGNRTHKGVAQMPGGKWEASITCDNKVHRLGRFESYKDACEARDHAETELFGEYSRLIAQPSPIINT